MKKTWTRQYKVELIILSIASLVFTASLYTQIQGFFIAFMDTDDYMRVVRIREFFQHYDLSDNVIKRCNVPFGCSLHWTRFYDFFLIIPSYVLSFFTASINNAIDYVCFYISPIVRIVTAIVFLKIVQNYMKRDNAFLCTLLFIVSPPIAINGNFGRPDHHAFIMLFMLLLLAKIIDASKDNFKKHFLSVAHISTLCIWISPETLIPLLLVDGVLLLYATVQKGEQLEIILRFLCLKNLEVTLTIGLILLVACQSVRLITALMLLGTYAAFQLIKKGKNPKLFILLCIAYLYNWMRLPVYYDEISVVHLALYASITFFFYALISIIGKEKKFSSVEFIISIVIVGLVIGGTFMLAYPKFLQGMSADVTPFVRQIWLKRVTEMRSPLADECPLLYILHALFTLVAIFNKSHEIYSGKYVRSQHETVFWLIIIACSLVYLVFAAFANRMLYFSALFSLPLLFELGMNSKYVSKVIRSIRIIITFFITVLFLFITGAQNDEEDSDTSRKKYTTRELYSEVDKLSSKPVVIMAHSNNGPEILYYTKHSAIGAPYHRQQEGIIASYKVMEAPYNEQEIKKILKETNALYILIKNNKANCDENKKYEKKSLPEMIISGTIPTWISIVPLPKKFNDIIIAKIVRYE